MGKLPQASEPFFSSDQARSCGPYDSLGSLEDAIIGKPRIKIGFRILLGLGESICCSGIVRDTPKGDFDHTVWLEA